MSLAELNACVNDACLAEFGEEFTYTRVASTPEDETGTLSGVKDTGAQAEPNAPGDDSTYLRLWGAAAVIALGLLRGDEITTANTVYKIVDMDQDPADGILFLLRKDRAAT